jgi:hypothetical protein
MNNYTIRPLRLGTIKRKKENMSYQCGVKEIIEFPLISYYVEGTGIRSLLIPEATLMGDKVAPYSRAKNESLTRLYKYRSHL